ncbi:MAG: non-canonical purine NTP pyrophosphatase, RdgB/HAM1 family [Epulopiscium sp. Nele67-Bin005]|nr:MAG: non-canonical purine NTP pyrophosphatase, RdgB/HAM1 family [Epulopiscium sp. Nele67-Bin005]
MKSIMLVTTNQGKVREVKKFFEDYNIITMADAKIDYNIEETGTTFEENAVIKVESIISYMEKKDTNQYLFMADDSGLEIDFLNKEPGVYSSRYLGEDTPYEEKNKIILERMEGVLWSNRTARFVCVIAIIAPNQKPIVTKGTIEGYIGFEAKGSNGFGYDPIFYINEETSLAELSAEEKNKISHRGKALSAMKLKIESEI